jgi:hypothetical protein
MLDRDEEQKRGAARFQNPVCHRPPAFEPVGLFGDAAAQPWCMFRERSARSRPRGIGPPKPRLAPAGGYDPGAPEGRLLGRQINRERGAAAHPRLDVKSAMAFAHEPLHDRETQARSLAFAFGGEAGLENPGQNFGRNARTIVSTEITTKGGRFANPSRFRRRLSGPSATRSSSSGARAGARESRLRGARLCIEGR